MSIRIRGIQQQLAMYDDMKLEVKLEFSKESSTNLVTTVALDEKFRDIVIAEKRKLIPNYTYEVVDGFEFLIETLLGNLINNGYATINDSYSITEINQASNEALSKVTRRYKEV